MRQLNMLTLAVFLALSGCGAEQATRATSQSNSTTTPAANIPATQTRSVELTQVAAALAPIATSAAPVATATSAAIATATRPPATATPIRPTATATPGKVEVKVENVNNVRDSIGSVYFIGEVVNTGQTDAGDIQVAISLLGDTGQTLASGSAGSFSMGLPFLKPGERTYFRTLIDKAPETWKEERVQVQAGQVTAFYRNLYYLDLKGDGVTCSPPPRASSWISCAGQAVNTGAATAKSVEITIAAYDAAGKLVAVNSTYARLDQIPAGGTAPFSLDFLQLKEVPAKIEVQVAGQKVT